MARPSSFTPETGNEICERIAKGKSLVKICAELDLTYSTVTRWLNDFEEFRANYIRAREDQADYLADEIIDLIDAPPETTFNKAGAEVIDNAWVTNQRNRIDARKWIASKLKPKKYGERQQVDLSGNVGLSALTDEQLAASLTRLAADAGVSLSLAGNGKEEAPK